MTLHLGEPYGDARLLEDLRSRFNAGERLRYLCFWSHRPRRDQIDASCLSQWFASPFVVDGQRYPTAEHFMMAEKATLFGDLTTRGAVLGTSDPGTAKSLGRQVRGFEEGAWTEHRFDIVLRANEAKFAQHPELGRYLQRTGERILVEASPFDRVWGVGLARDDARILDPNQWLGLNLLGFALMRVRCQIAAERLLSDAR
jgi:ribA/ribD-fused uncharacterized protein